MYIEDASLPGDADLPAVAEQPGKTEQVRALADVVAQVREDVEALRAGAWRLIEPAKPTEALLRQLSRALQRMDDFVDTAERTAQQCDTTSGADPVA